MRGVVTPAGLYGNLCAPIFSNMKKWDVKCGACGCAWRAKIVWANPSNAVCPSCGVTNRWSLTGLKYEEGE